MNARTKAILKAGLIVGTSDIVCACVHAYIKSGVSPAKVLRYVASGLVGPAAHSGGIGTAIAGLFLHYCTAMAFTWFFFQVYGWISKRITITLLLGILYGITVWIVMNFLVVPLSRIPTRPMQWRGILESMTILILAIGIPLAFLARNYYLTGNRVHEGKPNTRTD